LATEKRARKKEHRDATLAARAAELRRRRNARLGGVALVLALVIGLALVSQPDDERGARNDAAASPAADAPPACGAQAPPAAAPQQYEEAPNPDEVLEAGTDYSAIIHTSCGDIAMELYEEDAPNSVANFVFLAREGFYDGLLWHRVEQDAVIQSGDPNGENGIEPDGPGYVIPDEFPDEAADYVYGVVGLANAGPGTTGSQFFIVVADPEKSCNAKGEPLLGEDKEADKRFHCPAGYQPLYSIVGRVDEASYATLETIASLEPRGGNDPREAVKPINPVYIESIEIIEA